MYAQTDTCCIAKARTWLLILAVAALPLGFYLTSSHGPTHIAHAKIGFHICLRILTSWSIWIFQDLCAAASFPLPDPGLGPTATSGDRVSKICAATGFSDYERAWSHSHWESRSADRRAEPKTMAWRRAILRGKKSIVQRHFGTLNTANGKTIYTAVT